MKRNVRTREFRRGKNWALSGAKSSFLRALIHNNPLAIVVLDEKQNIRMCNPAFERMFLVRWPAIRGANIDNLVSYDKETWTEAHKLSQDIIAGRIVSQSTSRSRTDGTIVDVDVHCLPLVVDGNVIGSYALYQDITERTRSLRALRQSEERYRRLFEKNLAGVFRTTIKEGRILDCNDAFARILGFDSRADILRKNALNLHFSKAARKQITSLLLDKGILTNHEIRLRRNDGKAVWVLENVTLFHGENDTPDVAEGTIVDITAQKQAARSLRRLSDRLLQVQDEERRRMARELHDMIGQSLAVVTMYLSVLKQSENVLDAAGQRALSQSATLAEQCAREIRTFSYLLHPPLLEEVGLISALRWYATGFSKRSGIAVELQLPEVLGRLPLPVETALFRIVQESLTNVLRHSGSSSAAVRLGRAKHTITLEIVDRGKGFTQDILNRPNHDVSTLGVGITGMHERMRQLGGNLEIESKKTGTIVRAVLPVKQREVPRDEAHFGGRRSRDRAPRTASPSRSKVELGNLRRSAERP